jgi:Tol biopolymer transport system component
MGNMKRTLLFATTVFAAVWFVSAALGETGNELFQKALVKERSEGNLKEAIKLYQQVVDKYGNDRALAAKALVAMAESQEKLGQAEARKTYERIVRDYADQKESATFARARLGGNASSLNAGIVSRQVWTGPKVDSDGTVSADGRYLSIVDWETGDLALHDLISGKDRRLTNKGSWADSQEFAEESAISPDGRQVAYDWFNGKDRYDLRVLNLNGPSTATPRIIYDNEDVEWIAPYAWSSDGKLIAVDIQRKDHSVQVGLVDSDTGFLRVLKSGNWAGAGKLAFSPDGRFLAFDRPSVEDSEQRDVFVLAVDGSREVPAVVHAAMDTLVDWTPDGKQLLFVSDRTGSAGIWALPFQDGKPQGSPVLIKSDVGNLYPLGLTRSGALYFGLRVGGPDSYVTSVDFSSGKILSPPIPATEQFVHSNRQPDWSPDGKYLAYSTPSFASSTRFTTLSIQPLENGKVRELHLRLNYLNWPRWSPDGTAFVAQGADLKGRQGVYKIDARSGDADLLVLNGGLPQWAPDGKRIYYSRATNDPAAQGDRVVVERDLASGNERELLRRKDMQAQSVSVSTDGRYLACVTYDTVTKEGLLVTLPVAGGEPKELLRLPFGGRFTAWTPDGRAILFTKNTSATGDEGNELWMIPAAGGQAKKIDLGISGVRGLRIQPGGNKMVFFTPGTNTHEVWALENFLPTLKASK